VWQIKPTIHTLLLYNQSLQLHPSFPSLLPTATPCTTFGTSALAVTPQDCLLTQPRTVDCPYIYPYSIPKYFLPWQLLLPHTIANIAPGHRPTAAEVRAFEASFYAAACSMPSHRGGALKPPKSYWHYLDYSCIQGVWKPKRIQDAPGELILHNKGTPYTIQRLEVHEAREALGIMSHPDCSMEDQVEAIQAKVTKWVDRIQTKHINATNVWCCLNSTITKTLEYPLMATTLTEEDLGAIMWPLLQAALPKCRVQKHFPRKVMFGTKRSQGIDIPSISVTQTVQHVQAIIRHGHRSSPSHDLHLHNMEAIQCHLGSEIPFWELPFKLHGGLAPEGWMKFAWQHLSPPVLLSGDP